MRPHRQQPIRLPVPGILQKEHWSGLPFPSPMHESEKWTGSYSVVSDSWWPHGLQPTRLLRPWDFPGKSTGVGCHRLLWVPTSLPYKYSQIQPQSITFWFFLCCFLLQLSLCLFKVEDFFSSPICSEILIPLEYRNLNSKITWFKLKDLIQIQNILCVVYQSFHYMQYVNKEGYA